LGRVMTNWLGWALTLQIVDSRPQICEHSKNSEPELCTAIQQLSHPI